MSYITDSIINYPNFSFNSTYNLAQLAHQGKWELLLEEFNKNDSRVIDLIKKEKNGENNLFWIALNQFVEDQNIGAFTFLNSVLGEIPDINDIDINVSPLEGPHQGKSILWLLAYRSYIKETSEDFQISFLLDETKLETFLRYSLDLLDCKVNTAPKEGPFQGVTVYCLLTCDIKHAINYKFFNTIINPSNEPVKCNMIGYLFFQLDWFSKLPRLLTEEKYIEILRNIYVSLIYAIRNNPTSNKINSIPSFGSIFDSNLLPVELVLSLPSTKTNARNTLLVSLIFLGAKISDGAKQEWKDEYHQILTRLKTVFQKALLVHHHDLAERHNFSLLKELRPIIVLDLIYAEFSELEYFPKEHLALGLKLLT